MRNWRAWGLGTTLLGMLAAGSPSFADSIIPLNLKTSDVVFDPGTQRLYASVPGDVLALGNSVVPINPVDGTYGTPILTGSQPGSLARSSDGTYLYVGIRGSHSVQRINLGTQAIDSQFDLGQDILQQSYFPLSLAAVPGLPNSVLVSLTAYNNEVATGLAVYDQGVRRPSLLGYLGLGNSLGFAPSPARFYSTYGGSVSRFNVDPAGARLVSTSYVNEIPQRDSVIHKGLLYTPGGLVYDPETASQVGAFAVDYGGPVCPDTDSGRVFFVTTDFFHQGYTLRAYNAHNYRLEGSLDLTGINGSPSQLLRCGSDGLAVITTLGQILLIHTSLVPTAEPPADLQVTSSVPASVPAGGTVSFTLTVKNNGAAASGVRLTDTLPAGSAFVSALASQGEVHGSDGLVTAALGSLEPGATATVTISARPRSAGSLVNTATATELEPDAEQGDNTVSSPVPVTAPTKADLTGKWLTVTLHQKRVGRVVQHYLQAKIRVQNQGLHASPRCVLKIYNTTDPTHLIYTVYRATLPPISARGSRTFSVRIPMPAFQHELNALAVAVLDAGEQVNEANEDDNAFAYGPLPYYP